jgi:hypothetical protein
MFGAGFPLCTALVASQRLACWALLSVTVCTVGMSFKLPFSPAFRDPLFALFLLGTHYPAVKVALAVLNMARA